MRAVASLRSRLELALGRLGARARSPPGRRARGALVRSSGTSTSLDETASTRRWACELDEGTGRAQAPGRRREMVEDLGARAGTAEVDATGCDISADKGCASALAPSGLGKPQEPPLVGARRRGLRDRTHRGPARSTRPPTVLDPPSGSHSASTVPATRRGRGARSSDASGGGERPSATGAGAGGDGAAEGLDVPLASAAEARTAAQSGAALGGTRMRATSSVG